LNGLKNKITAGLLLIFFILNIFTVASCVKTDAENNDDGKIKIVATLFPQYDFAKQIAGDKANVTLLLPPGTESHGFDPKPADMVDIYDSDLFVYTGKEMEPWAETIIKTVKNDALVIVDCSENITLLDSGEDEHDDHDDHDHDEHTHEYEHGADPHIWLDPTRAMIMVDNILNAFIEKDSENADFYTQNAENYKKQLQKLDDDIFDVINNAKRNVIVFGGRFSYIYFLTHFHLDYVTAYDSCSTNAEPSVSKIGDVIDFIRENNIPCIYYEELADPKVAKSISNETKTEYLQFSTAHNVTKSEFDNGITFLDIMYDNLENLKKGLNQ